MKQIKGEDQISVVMAKIAFYCDVIRNGLSLYDKNVQIIQMDTYEGVVVDLFKIQAFINRFHSSIYEKDMQKQFSRYQVLSEQFGESISTLPEYNEYLKLKGTYSDKVVSSLSDEEARVSHKTVIELTLEENVSHTSNLCQLGIRKLVTQTLKVMNRKVGHFSMGYDEKYAVLNQVIGKLIAEEFRDFTRLSKELVHHTSDLYIMKISCQHSAVLGELNKLLFQNQLTSGFLLYSFVANKGLEYVKELVLWMIEAIRLIEN